MDPLDEDRHIVWQSGGQWWTSYPPPAGFDGEEIGDYGAMDYRRELAPEEQAVVDADEAESRARAEAHRREYFGLADPDGDN